MINWKRLSIYSTISEAWSTSSKCFLNVFLISKRLNSIGSLPLIKKKIITQLSKMRLMSTQNICKCSQYRAKFKTIKDTFLIHDIHHCFLHTPQNNSKTFQKLNATWNVVKQPQRLKRQVTAATSTFGIKTEQHGRATASVTVETHVRPVCMGRDGQQRFRTKVVQN